MFIQTEPTPNPATLKFLPGRPVLASGTLDMRDKETAAQSPLAQRLFDIAGVSGVFYGSDFIAVTNAEVWELQVGGRQVLAAPFINVSRDHIEIILPGH